MIGSAKMDRGNCAVYRRLAGYWKMEAGCGILIPVIVISMARPQSFIEWGGLLLALLACCALLFLGAGYWHACQRALRSDRVPLRRLVTWADRLQPLLIALCLLSISVAVGLMVLYPSPAATASAAIGVLAVLEYVNYFHLQLQHFDHLPDLKRLLRTRRLRPSHLATDLAAYRQQRASWKQLEGPGRPANPTNEMRRS